MEKCKLSESIKAQRLVLKKREHEHDADVWQAIESSRLFLREYLFWVDGTTSFDDVVKATDFFAEQWKNDGEWCYNIYSLEDNRFLGCIGVHAINFQNRTAELGYWLKKEETRKGYMKEAVLAIEEEVFKAGFHRVEIIVDKYNTKSMMVAENCEYDFESVAYEALYHYTGLHDKFTYVKFSPYPVKGF